MQNIFNFSECYRLLKTNPKTFQGWLKKAGIDPEKQVNVADPRQKYLTVDQLQMLASTHGRTLPPLVEEEAATAPVTLETLAEQLTSVRDLLTEVAHSLQRVVSVVQERGEYQSRFDRVDHALVQMTALVQESMTQQKDLLSSQQEHKMSSEAEAHHVDEVAEILPSVRPVSEEATPASTASTATKMGREQPKRAKATAKRPTKKKRPSKAKSLPRTLVPLRVVAKQHEIDTKVADRVSESGKLAVVSGNWLYESRAVTKALDIQGQQEFYRVFHLREGFTRCEQCPHGVQEQDAPTEAQTVSIAG